MLLERMKEKKKSLMIPPVFFELMAQAPVLLERTLYTEKVLYLAK